MRVIRGNRLFQSTLSVRRATESNMSTISIEHISIHALRKESDEKDLAGGHGTGISIHALRKESDSTVLASA